ncbi:MAG: cysteine--tRNA ligase [Bacteroidales bacterium OttesenSCG-928-I14]|jgi:cysteinyl-tRNA synthetase|nr:cysteine--tRNA ligase [Bacteroidales bacterium OttesenSCG-928-I14]
MSLFIYNTLTKKKELFIPLLLKRVGIYVCGPTVYGDSHLGHARSAIAFDTLFRYLMYLGYKVRYVRNVTDVGHLMNDSDLEKDKIVEKARLESIEPMEVVQYYLNRYHEIMNELNVLPPSIEPHASGHIIEQILLSKEILDKGYAYESNGSIYFDVEKYNKKYSYGKLSGQNISDLLKSIQKSNVQKEKRNIIDFALWKKASQNHIMRWKSPWGEGFPGWHLECTTMSKKYLGDIFDIHGGGMDLIFPHHECEIAQNLVLTGHEGAKYWMHNNMITINGKKMGKSFGNFISLEHLFNGSHPLLTKSYTPMTIRFFIVRSHYRSVIDFSNRDLESSEKELSRLLEASNNIKKLKVKTENSKMNIENLRNKAIEAMDDDLNTPVVISCLFDAAKLINLALIEQIKLTSENIQQLNDLFQLFLFNLLGIKDDFYKKNFLSPFGGAIDLLLQIRMQAKQRKDWITSDFIRYKLIELGFEIRDTKNGVEWELK